MHNGRWTGAEDIGRKVNAILVEQLGVDDEEVTPDASIGDDLGADSLDQVEIVMALEEEFGLEIPDEDATGWKTAQDIVTYVDAKRTAATR